MQSQESRLLDWQARRLALQAVWRELDFATVDAEQLIYQSTLREPLVIEVTEVTPVPAWPPPFQVVGLDGSEALLSHHEALALPVLTVAAVQLGFGAPSQVVEQVEVPELSEVTVEAVSRARAAAEWRLASNVMKSSQLPTLLLLDGSLIPWSLIRLNGAVRTAALAEWHTMTSSFIGQPVVGYISQSGASECVRTLQALGLASKAASVDLLDRHLMTPAEGRIWSPIFTLSFGKKSPLPQIKMLYLHVDNEWVRLEWLAEQSSWLTTVLPLILAQATDGQGYPAALSEAHERAIIRGSDRLLLKKMEERLLSQVLVGSAKGLRKTRRGLR